ncbi:hypothetical protein [Bifidobacterium sp.]|nr:hypothetical protein [Bifidobacterium sp.]
MSILLSDISKSFVGFSYMKLLRSIVYGLGVAAKHKVEASPM